MATLIRPRQVEGLSEAYTDITALKTEVLLTRKILNFIKDKNENLILPNDLQIKELSEEAEKEI